MTSVQIISQKALDKFGKSNQIIKCMEEMAELTKEFSKILLCDIADTPVYIQILANICEEIADVQIVLDQMKLVFPEWKEAKEKKFNRLKEMVK